MTLSVATRTFAFGDGLTYAAQDVRLLISALVSGLTTGAASALEIGSGVCNKPGNPLLVSTAGGLSLTVNTGQAAIQGSAATNVGTYVVTLDTTATLACSAADTVNPRVDLVCLTVTDNGNNTSTSVVQVVTGTPGSSPSAPALPSNSVPLCTVTVPANATTLTSANLADVRPFMVAAGGIVPVQGPAQYPTHGPSSSYVHDYSTGRLRRYNGGAGTLVAPSVAGFASVYAGPNASATANVAPVTVESASVTVDGTTSVKITITWAQIVTGSTVQGSGVQIQILRGATALRNYFKIASYANAVLDAGTIVYTDILPAAGTYTYEWTIVNQGAGTFSVKNGDILLEAIAS